MRITPLAVLLAFLALSACGVKGDLRLPQKETPRAEESNAS